MVNEEPFSPKPNLPVALYRATNFGRNLHGPCPHHSSLSTQREKLRPTTKNKERKYDHPVARPLTLVTFSLHRVDKNITPPPRPYFRSHILSPFPHRPFIAATSAPSRNHPLFSSPILRNWQMLIQHPNKCSYQHCYIPVNP